MPRNTIKPNADRLILGLGVFAHDTSAAFMRGGRVLFAAEQERFDRVKHSRAFPLDAMEAGLKFLGCTIADVDDLIINYDPVRLVGNYVRHVLRHLPGSLGMVLDPLRIQNVWRSRGYWNAIAERFQSDLAHVRWACVPHHLAHGASAYYRSGYEKAAILTSDSLGEFESVMKGVGEGNRLRVLETIDFPHSVGAVYSAVTDHLGFAIYSGEGTVMGLAAFGRTRPELSMTDLLRLSEGGDLRLDSRFFTFPTLPWVHEQWVTSRFARKFGPRRAKREPVNQHHADLARAVQNLADQSLMHLCSDLYKKTNMNHLCYAGGVALNGYGNTRILQETPFRNLYIQPASNDGGTSLGAALYHSHHVLDLPRDPDPDNIFLGPEYSSAQCEEALRKSRVSWTKPQNLLAEVAGLLHQSCVVGWFQGKMELGPRALGNRSILANPCDPRMKDRLNLEIKHREPFRPYAPMVPEERADEFFEMPCRESPYMLLIMNVRPEWRSHLPAVTHADGTARVQTVTKISNSRLKTLLSEFEKLSGVPVLLNTSFNGPGEPIVCTPEDALLSYEKWGLDALVLGDFLVRVPKN